MNRKKRVKKDKEYDLLNGNKKSHTIDIRKLFLRDAPKRTGYRPVPGVSIYPRNFKEPKVLETINELNFKRECCSNINKDICRCGDVVACPASQEFKSNQSSDVESTNNGVANTSGTQDPIDFRGLRGMLWSKIDPEKLEMFERRFSEPNATGSSPVGLTENFGTPIFYSNSQPPLNHYTQESEGDNSQVITQEDIMLLMEMYRNCTSQVEGLDQDLRLNMELQSSIENEIQRGIQLLRPRLKQLAISERNNIHIIVNSLSSKVGFPKFDIFYKANSDETEYISKSWFMGMDAMDIVNQHHKIADLQNKLLSNSLVSSDYNGFLSNYELGCDEDDAYYDEFDNHSDNKQINEDNELTIQCRSVLSKYLGSKLHEREKSLMLKRNLLVKLSNLIKLLESSPLSNFPFTLNNRHMFLNPIGIGRRSIIWKAFDFVDLVPCVLKLFRIDFPSLNECNGESSFSPNVSISSNTHKLRLILGDYFTKLRKIRSVYSTQMNKLKSKEIPVNILLFLNHTCNISLDNTNIIKSKQMNHGISELKFCTAIFEWQTPPSMNSTIVEAYSHLERYDIHSYVHLNGVLSETTALMYSRSLFRLFLLIHSFEGEEGFTNSVIFPIKASKIYIRKEDCCFSIGPLDLINLDIDFSLFQDDEISIRKNYPKNLMRCKNFIKNYKDDDLINYFPKFIRGAINDDQELLGGKNIKILKSKLIDIEKSFGLSKIVEKVHVYMIGSLLYYSLSNEYYNPNNNDCFSRLENVSLCTKELLMSILNENIAEIPNIVDILSHPALHPERLVGTVGVQNNYNIFQYQLSEFKFDT
ncbi:hypothetical protein FG386_000142 [Cryptosporidium ryanae]|uniref:uncharacterized protein n=1 Tax=Cryptosporidium ryanae TaxID=515981 RepID=UPI00351A6277|nr:hypothetical protein FG386_000142 [Cryptosporidium ryanae]